ncbi:hypothetical protein E4K72_11270 [Oxalobacteraceae bacterium OM1]|nr:hypothetical protein E4K72_11270 [Oxalobacteraceae bacterium OM1]
MFRIFETFLHAMRAGFQRIVRATKHEITLGDLHSDAWVIAFDIGARRGKPIDFADPADRDAVMAALYVHNVKRADRRLRYAARLDQELRSEDGQGRTLADVIPERVSSDPLVALLAHENARDRESMLAASYSEATAYVLTFDRFDACRQAICTHLAIAKGTLRRRIDDAVRHFKVQASMFDRIERIPGDFMPAPGKRQRMPEPESRAVEQRRWEFPESSNAAEPPDRHWS